MKAKIAAAVLAVFAAFGIGAGVANAAEPAVTEPVSDSVVTTVPQQIDAALKSIDFNKESQPAPESPLQDVVKFLQDGITLAGRDVLTTGTVYADDIPDGGDNSDVDNPEPPFKLPQYDDPNEKNIETEPEFSILTVLGNAVDAVVAPIPGINKIRETDAWDSDYFRIFGALAVITTALLPVTVPGGIVAGIGTSAVLGIATFAAAVILGGLGGVPVGILPAVVLGIVGAVLLVVFVIATPLWLIAGIILVVIGVVGTGATAGVGSPMFVPFIAAGAVMILFGLMPFIPIGIALGILGLAIFLFWAPVIIGALIMAPIGVMLGVAVFFLSLFITVPLGIGIAVGTPLLFAFLAIVLWLNNEPTRKKEGEGESDEVVAKKANVAVFWTRDDTEGNKNFLNKLGDYADWFWDDLQWIFGKIVFIGPSLQRGINAMRHSKLWKSDPFRIAATVAFLSVFAVAPISGLLILGAAAAIGFTAGLIVDVVLALPLTGLGVLLTGLLILVAALIPVALFVGGIFFVVLGVLVFLVGCGVTIGALGTIMTGLLTAVGAVMGSVSVPMIFIGLAIILGGFLVIGISLIPFLWIPILGLVLFLGAVVIVLLTLVGMLLAAPVAAAVAAVVFAGIGVFAIAVPVAVIGFGLMVLVIGLIFGLVLPTRPAGEPLPKITTEDDPEYQHKDDWRYGRTDTKHWDNPNAPADKADAEKEAPEEKEKESIVDKIKNPRRADDKDGKKSDYALAA